MAFQYFFFFAYVSFSLILQVSFQNDNLSLGKFPFVKKLNNNKYIALDQNGIYLIDENFQSKEKVIVSKTISSYNARSANIAQFSKEYNNIIIVINGINLYIISQEGNLLANKESVTFLDITKFYSIIPYEKEDNEYIFYLLFYDSSSDKKLRYSKGTYE